MKEINLREYYPELYTEDSVISVSDEIAEMMRRSILEEKAYQRRLCRYQAYYSLDYALTRRKMKEICSTTKHPKTCRSKRSADENCKKHSERSPHPSSGASIKGTFFV